MPIQSILYSARKINLSKFTVALDRICTPGCAEQAERKGPNSRALKGKGVWTIGEPACRNA